LLPPINRIRLPGAPHRAVHPFRRVEYGLQGALAQFSRSSLAQDLGRRLVAGFAASLNAKSGGTSAPQAGGAALCAGRLVWLSLGDRRRRLLGR
jgi:aerobic carbon-monoxide dehydrogenase small subunit